MLTPRQLEVRDARLATLGRDESGAMFLATAATATGGQLLRVESLSGTETAQVASASAILAVELSNDQAGRLLAVWNQIEPEGAKLYWAVRTGPGVWTKPALVAALYGTQICPALARDGLGRAWLAFSGNATGRHQIFLAYLSGGQWSFPQRISDGDGHCFSPSLCRFGNGVRAVWDGRFGVFMREFDSTHEVGAYEPQATVAESPSALLAEPTVVALDEETSLIVYETSRPGWGVAQEPRRAAKLAKTERNFLQSHRELRAAVIGPEGVAPLKTDLAAALAWPPSHTRTRAKLARSADGTIWLTYRQAAAPETPGRPPQRFVQALTCYRRGGWAEPILLADSGGTSRMSVSLAGDDDGALTVAYAERRKGHSRMHVNRLEPAESGACPPTKRFVAMQITRTGKPRRTKRVTLDGQFGSPRLLFGDLHRHSDLSACHRWVEGSAFDAYRHALTVGELDFFAVTDHAWHLATPDTLTEAHPLADAFNLPGHFTAMRAYEANFFDGDGHMVVLGDDHPLAISQARTRAELLAELDPAHVVAVPHHPADPEHYYRWQGHDDAIGPVAEIYQPYRTSFEAVDAPAPTTPWRLAADRAIRPECTLQAAWRAGHRLGVIASSDHLSTGGAFAAVWAERNTRDAILAALRRRHCYAATAKIELAFWADEHFMGDAAQVETGRTVSFRIRVRGTARLRKVELLADGETVHVFKPAKNKAKTDRLKGALKRPAEAGEHYYYLRVIQADGNMAWSSPIWLTGQEP